MMWRIKQFSLDTSGTTAKGGATFMLKSYFGHISETIKARDLIFGKGTPYNMENKRVQSGYQLAALPPKVAPPTSQNLVLAISQRLLKLET